MDDYERGFNDAIEVAAEAAENWGSAPRNPHGRRAKLAKSIRALKKTEAPVKAEPCGMCGMTNGCNGGCIYG